ncbi:MAG: hypothetical protein CMJ83_21890 [Planctomycetes bacterium]|nr:hypothetical protein [Planctomycetota bacterium]
MIFLLTAAITLSSCGKDEPSNPSDREPLADPSGAGGGSHHGAMVALGTIGLAGETFTVTREGECIAGKECAFAVARVGAGTSAALYLWVEDAAGEQVSAPVQGDGEDGHWHFHVTPQANAQPSKVVLRRRGDGKDDRAPLSLHAGAAPQSDGIAAPVQEANGAVAGWIELKLHDDKGDLELWVTTDGAMTRPMDLPIDTVIKVAFPALGNRTVDLRVRNAEKNEDEGGKPNIRAGKTNYFIFPGDTGADASWLQGAKFKSPVKVSFSSGSSAYASTPFVLVPHVHGAGDHTH